MNMISYVRPQFTHIDDRGWLHQLCNSGWNQVNVSFCKKGFRRGGHYHKNNKEFFYVVSGSFDLMVELNGDNKKFQMKKDDFFIIHEQVMHTFYYTEDTLLVSMYDIGVENQDHTLDIYVR